MNSEIQDPNQRTLAGGEQTDEEGKEVKITKILVAEKAIETFVAERDGDRIGLFLFDDEVYYSWPLSTHLDVILFKNKGISKSTGGGTNFEGDGIKGKMGPIQAAIEHFKELGQAKTKILVMVTDGEASISDERFEDLIKQMNEIGMKIYTIGVGDSWTNGNSSTNDLRRLTEATGGLAIAAGDAEQMRQAFQTINELEKSDVELQKTIGYRDIYAYFAFAAGVAMLLFLLATVMVREDL
jgi:Ca-activated chloride channel family protein